MTSYESPIPIENALQAQILITSSLSMVIPTSFVALRLCAKFFKTTSRVDLTDFALFIALLFNIALHTDYFLLVFKGGMGFLPGEIVARFGPETLTFFSKAIVSVGVMYNLTVYTCKIPVLLMYATLMPVPKMILCVRICAVLFTASYLSTAIAPFFLCQPLAYNWDKTISGGSCGNWPLYYTFCGALNITYEVILLCLPVPLFLRLQAPLTKRLLLVGMFTVGFATCAIGIYRQTTIPGLDFNLMTVQGIGATVFSGLEPPVAISLSCVPFLRQLFKNKGGKSSASAKLSYGHIPCHSSHRGCGFDSQIQSRIDGKMNRAQFEKLPDDSSEMELQPSAAYGSRQGIPKN